MHTKAKSATSFRDFEHKANEVFEFGNDWGFYIDIESNSSLIDMSFIKNRLNYEHSVKTNKHLFRRKMESLNTKNNYTIKNSDDNYDNYDNYDKNDKTYYRTSSFIQDNININNKNKPNKHQESKLQVVSKNMRRFIMRFLIRNSCTIVSFFVFSCFMFKIRNK